MACVHDEELLPVLDESELEHSHRCGEVRLAQDAAQLGAGGWGLREGGRGGEEEKKGRRKRGVHERGGLARGF
jgi:hypothetical protein